MSEILREIILAELEQEEIADGIEAPLMQVQETEDIPQVTAKLMAKACLTLLNTFNHPDSTPQEQLAMAQWFSQLLQVWVEVFGNSIAFFDEDSEDEVSTIRSQSYKPGGLKLM